MLATLVISDVVQLVPALKGKQSGVVIRDHLDRASPCGQVYLGHLRPREFLGVEDRLGRSAQLASETVTELDACRAWPARKRAHLRGGDVRELSQAPVEIGVQEGRLSVLRSCSD